MNSLARTALAAALGVGVLGGGIVGVAQAAPPDDHVSQRSYIVRLQPGADARGVARALAVSPRFVYSEVFDGFAADLTEGQINALRRNGSVRDVEIDRVATVVPMGKTTKPGGGKPTEPAPAPTPSPTPEPTPEPTPVPDSGVWDQPLPADGSLWGLDRIDAGGLDWHYRYPGTGAGVTAYVVDTGISTAHADFGGRAQLAFDNVGGRPARGGDCNGHGTHVAGTIGGTVYGVAKGVQLRSVRVLDCNGSGPYSGVIAGLDYVLQNHSGPSVVNLSIGGPKSPALNDAVTKLVDSGVFVAVAAGNETLDACASSPSSAAAAVTVAASDSADELAFFSNYGSCVDVMAPGVDITSDWLNGGVNRISGTSMATPHVTGAASVYLGAHADAGPGDVASWIGANAVSSAASDNFSGTPNLLLNLGGPFLG